MTTNRMMTAADQNT